MANTRDGRKDILVDPTRYEMEAAWVKEASVWARMVERMLHCMRRQPTAIGVGATVGVLWITGARAHDTGILFAALGAIVVMTVSAELMDGKNNDQHRGEGEA